MREGPGARLVILKLDCRYFRTTWWGWEGLVNMQILGPIPFQIYASSQARGMVGVVGHKFVSERGGSRKCKRTLPPVWW